MEQKSGINWKQMLLPILITAIVTIAVGIIVGLSLTHFQMREPKLVYYAEDTLPYKSPTGDTAIYHVKIENLGKEATEEVVCILAFEKATIEQSRIIVAPSIDYSEIVGNNSYRVDLPSLNPHESATLSVLASGTDNLPPRPEVSLRGKGITGTEATKTTGKETAWWGILVAILASLAGVGAGGLTLRSTLMKMRKSISSGVGSDGEQKGVLAYLCEIHGLNDDARTYRSMVQEAKYWSESDRLAMESRMEPLGEMAQRRKQVLKDLLEYAGSIATQSLGIVHYNVALIAKARGEENEAEEHLKEARKLIPEILEKRMKLDPIWKKK